VWETDPTSRDTEAGAAFADVSRAIPKVVFSRSDRQGGFVGDAAWPRIELGLVDELRLFRYPVVVGGGTPFLPPVTEKVPLDLIETRTFGSRVIHERYGRARGDSE
jgi:dihydrofolate reductase